MKRDIGTAKDIGYCTISTVVIQRGMYGIIRVTGRNLQYGAGDRRKFTPPR